MADLIIGMEKFFSQSIKECWATGVPETLYRFQRSSWGVVLGGARDSNRLKGECAVLCAVV